jgi:hypothetical protein
MIEERKAWLVKGKINSAKGPSPRDRSGLLNLPLELRLEIYEWLSANSSMLISRPPIHVLYPLLFVSHGIRQEVTPFFYPIITNTFTFTTPRSCSSFLTATTSHIHLITSLTLHLPANETAKLKPIFKLLHSSQSKLLHLSIHLIPNPGKYTALTRPKAAYTLPRRVGLSQYGKFKITQRNKRNFLYRLVPETFEEKDHLDPFGWRMTGVHNTDNPLNQLYMRSCFSEDVNNFEYSNTHSRKALMLAALGGAFWMGKVDCLRYLAVYGVPVGKGRVAFELGVLWMYTRMMERAKAEGKDLQLGFGSRVANEKFRYFDAWIEGEEVQVLGG